MPREDTPSADTRSDAEREVDGETVPGSDDLRRALAARAGEVACEESRQAVRAFDDDCGEARRALSTMAVRIAVQVIEPAVVAVETDDATETVAELFVDE